MLVPFQKEVQSEDEDYTILNDGVPLSPDWMNSEARMEWIRSAPELYKRGILIGANIALFENYCVNIGLAREFENMLENDGKIINGKPHPAFKMMLDAMSSANAIAAQLKFNKDLKSNEDDNEIKDSKWDKKLLA